MLECLILIRSPDLGFWGSGLGVSTQDFEVAKKPRDIFFNSKPFSEIFELDRIGVPFVLFGDLGLGLI